MAVPAPTGDPLKASTGGGVTVTIGAEGPYEQLSATSIVTTGYGPHDEAVAHAADRSGPTRMDYPGTMAAVRVAVRSAMQVDLAADGAEVTTAVR